MTPTLRMLVRAAKYWFGIQDEVLIRGTFLEGLTLAIRFVCTSFSYVLLRLKVYLANTTAAPAKGGITSSDIGTRGLQVKKALAMGQILPGFPSGEPIRKAVFPVFPM